jgi:hypothetical protein
MTRAKYVPGVKGMRIERPLMHRPARLTFWAVWCSINKNRRPDVGQFASEYGGTPMLFFKKADAVKYIGRDWRRGIPVKVALRVSKGVSHGD